MSKLVLGVGEIPPEIAERYKDSPFLPVCVAFHDVLRNYRGELTVGQLLDAAVSIAVTSAINLHIQYLHDPNGPSITAFASEICHSIMEAAAKAEAEFAQQTGQGATKQ